MMKSYAPRASLNILLQSWWLLVLVAILGGAVGLGFTWLQPPVYEARSVVSLAIDFSRTGELDGFETDRMLGIVGSVIASTQVMTETVEDAQQTGISIDLPAFKQSAVAERKDTLYLLRVRHTDPQTAQTLAQLWTKRSMAALETAYEHALRAEAIQRSIDALESCLGQVAANAPGEGVCNLGSLEAIQQALGATGKAAAQERKDSRGLSAALRFTLAEEALLPQKAAQYGRGTAALAGTLIGFILGLAAVQTRSARRRGHA